MSIDADRSSRWRHEAAFFDAEALQASKSAGIVDPLALARYSSPNLRRRFAREFCFRLLGEIEGKTILDVGCGYGGNSIMFAKMGAKVTAVDISPLSIKVARERADANAVREMVTFLCSPLETVQLEDHSFDIIWGDNILHHVTDELDSLLAALMRLGKPGGLVVFCEPVNLNYALRRVRLMLPIHTDATPGERPLERRDLSILRSHIPQLRLRFFDLLGRLDRFILVRNNYERSSLLRRFVSNVVACVDWTILTIPGFRNLAGQTVMWATVDPPPLGD